MGACRLIAGAAVLASVLLTGCGQQAAEPTASLASCGQPSHSIAAVQGSDFKSPLLGQAVQLQGVVTHLAANGAYLQSAAADNDPRTSEGLFLTGEGLAGQLRTGQLLQVSGEVAELGERRDTITSLVNLTSLAVCSEQANVPVTRIELPMRQGRREAFEGMLVDIGSRSFITDVYRLADGVIRISANGALPIPTEVAWPGKDARRQQSENWDNTLFVGLVDGDRQAFPVEAELLSDQGVLGHDGIGPRLLLNTPTRIAPPAIPVLAAAADDELRVVSLNLENYFNGDGRNGGFPTPRGAETPEEFAVQRARLVAALAWLQPHIVAVMELENDGFDQHSAAADFLDDLRAATGASWQVADPGQARIGTDQITVGLFYRPDVARAIGAAQLLDAAPFDLLNRTPLSQLFEDQRSGTRFVVNVNHFKSKGGCPEQGRDQDQDDGQGCWNPTRTAAAQALAPWVHKLAGQQQAGGRALILGDLNAYRMEDPVRSLVKAGYLDLTGDAGEIHRFSYVFGGQSGTLDHALATPELASSVVRAQILNINSPFPAGVPLEPLFLRSSDHDPVLVDLRFLQSATSP
jgi:predicted extracellular nuclease